MATTTPSSKAGHRPGRLLAWAGIALVILGPLLYFAQIQGNILTVPWHAPILGSVGLVVLAVGLLRSLTAWRLVGVVLLGLLVAGQWYWLTILTKLPPLSETLSEGRPLPAFTSVLADGTTFTPESLAGGKHALMVFFRGRW